MTNFTIQNYEWQKLGNVKDFSIFRKPASGPTGPTGPISIDLSGNNEVAYIAKLDTSGNYQWVQKVDGRGNDRGNGIAVDDTTGNVYATGYFDGSGNDITVTFGGGKDKDGEPV